MSLAMMGGCSLETLNMKGDTMVGTIPLWWGLCTLSWGLGLHRG